MFRSALSIKVFGIYAILIGIVLVVAPAALLTPLGLPAPTDVWVRMLGVIAIVLGYYYWVCGTAGAPAFFRASIRGRVFFFCLCALLVILRIAPAQVLIFGAVDLVGAAWTALALRREAARE